MARWATLTVPVAYALRYATYVRPVMPGSSVSLDAVVQSRRPARASPITAPDEL